MIAISELFVEYRDTNTGEDVIDNFKFPQDMTDEEVEAELADMLHPFEFRILK